MYKMIHSGLIVKFIRKNTLFKQYFKIKALFYGYCSIIFGSSDADLAILVLSTGE